MMQEPDNYARSPGRPARPLTPPPLAPDSPFYDPSPVPEPVAEPVQHTLDSFEPDQPHELADEPTPIEASTSTSTSTGTGTTASADEVVPADLTQPPELSLSSGMAGYTPDLDSAVQRGVELRLDQELQRRQTRIPILITCGGLLTTTAILELLADPESGLAPSARGAPVVLFIGAGLVFLIAAVNMLQARDATLAKRARRRD